MVVRRGAYYWLFWLFAITAAEQAKLPGDGHSPKDGGEAGDANSNRSAADKA